MNTRRPIYIALASAAMALTSQAATVLPKVEILGKEYYYYEVKKGESIYGIAKKLGWNIDELVKLNPNTISHLGKGSILYYPVATEDEGKEVTETSPSDIGEMPYAPVTHVVKKGETVFSISRQYNIPLETIYANHPSAKYGIKVGEVIELKQAPQTAVSGNGYIYYNVKSGDTLFSLAQQYNTSVEDILRCNPGVTEDNFKAGSTVRISADPARRATRTEVVEEQKVAAVDNYKVKKNDTWDAISKQTGVDKTTLKEANENIAKPRKDDVIVVPKVETVKVEREVVAQDPREATPEGREELYDSIHNVVDAAYLPQVNVALLMDDPSSKRDLEFSRGILLAIDELKKAPYKINFKIIDGRVSTTAVLDQLEDFEPNLLLTTADKNFPAFLADYGNENHVEIVNVFDVKNDLFEDNPSVIQLLPPSSLFNDEVGEYVGKAYGGSTILWIGDRDENDAIAESIASALDGSITISLSPSELSEFDFSDGGRYLVYGFAQKRDDVLPIAKAVANAKDNNPQTSISLMGRPSWITMAENYGSEFADADVFIPSRFYYDTQTSGARRFTSEFSSMYGYPPVKSFPMFAVTGYDVARYFIPSTATTAGDPNRKQPSKDALQTDFDLRRVSNWGGFVNPTCYILRFVPGVGIEKVTLK